MGAFVYRDDAADVARRIAHVLELFNDLAARQDQVAGRCRAASSRCSRWR